MAKMFAGRAVVTGMDAVAKEINKWIAFIATNSQRGLNAAGELVLKDAWSDCPVVEGNLYQSGFVVAGKRGDVIIGQSPQFVGKRAARHSGDHKQSLGEARSVTGAFGQNPSVAIGFGVRYAIVVHENQNAGKATYPGASKVGKWKFLEDSVKKNEAKIVDIVANHTRLK